jgi:hypothetical protein
MALSSYDDGGRDNIACPVDDDEDDEATTSFAKYDHSDFSFDVDALVDDMPRNASPNTRGDRRGPCVVLVVERR